MELDCPFCSISNERIFLSNDIGIAIKDGFPISAGHTLIIPKRHFPSWFDGSEDEHQELLKLLSTAKEVISKEYNPDGFNIGINDGTTAGQTVHHLHIHLIPRYKNDIEEPRGGIRWIIPNKAKYW